MPICGPGLNGGEIGYHEGHWSGRGNRSLSSVGEACPPIFGGYSAFGGVIPSRPGKECRADWRRALTAEEIQEVRDNGIQVTPPEVDITIDGDLGDWADVPVLIEDPDDVAEDNGDIKSVRIHSTADTLYAMLMVYGTAAPPPPDAQRYYYHILIDADNNLETGFNNSSYEDSPTGVVHPIGADFYAMIGRRNGADVSVVVAACPGTEVHTGDANCDGGVDIADAIKVLGFLFGGDSMIAPDNTTIAAGAAGCSRYPVSDVVLPCANPCTAR